MDVYDTDGTSVAVEAQYDSGQTPCLRYALGVSFLDLAEVNGSPAVWIPEGGNFLIFQGIDGVVVHVEGAVTMEEAIRTAEEVE